MIVTTIESFNMTLYMVSAFRALTNIYELTVHVRTIAELFVNNLCYMEVSSYRMCAI